MALPTFDEAKVALLSGFRSPKQHGNFPWRGVSWRFISAAIYMILIVVSLHLFARRESLAPWERRVFNVLTILLSGLVSLSLGSLLGLLGSILRWRLLARATTTPRDVDLILGIHTPAGAFKLICHHLGPNGKWSRTTAIVLVYLIANIAGRLSVAAFGLTYDFNENVGIEYPAKFTNFGSPNWVHGNASLRNMRRMKELALPGFWLVPTTEFRFEDPSYTLTDIGGSGLNLTVEGDKVTYSYPFKEFYGPDESTSADKVMKSSVSCIGRTFRHDLATNQSDVYHKGNLVDQPNGTSLPDFLGALKSLLQKDPGTSCWWSMKGKNDTSVDASGCDTTYLFRSSKPGRNQWTDGTFYECKTCLADRVGNPGLDPSAFHGFPAKNLPYAAGMLLRYTSFDTLGYAEDLVVSIIAKIAEVSIDYYSALSYECSDDDVDFMTEIKALGVKKDDKDWYKSPVPLAYELGAAHVVARAPVLAIVGAERLLPKVLKDAGASERPYVTVSLGVKWAQSFGVVGAISAGQLLAIAAVYFYTGKKVLLRDHDSYLAAARLLRTAVSDRPDDGYVVRSTESGEEIARRLQGDAKVKGLKYGTKTNNSGVVEVDLWYSLHPTFNIKAS